MSEQISGDVIKWLASGERGISSNTIVTVLTGIDAMGGWNKSAPSDPADLMRCEKLLSECPELRPRMIEMAEVSNEWAGLVAEWDRLVALVLEEAPGWMQGKGSAPKAYARMKEILMGEKQ